MDGLDRHPGPDLWIRYQAGHQPFEMNGQHPGVGGQQHAPARPGEPGGPVQRHHGLSRSSSARDARRPGILTVDERPLTGMQEHHPLLPVPAEGQRQRLLVVGHHEGQAGVRMEERISAFDRWGNDQFAGHQAQQPVRDVLGENLQQVMGVRAAGMPDRLDVPLRDPELKQVGGVILVEQSVMPVLIRGRPVLEPFTRNCFGAFRDLDHLHGAREGMDFQSASAGPAIGGVMVVDIEHHVVFAQVIHDHPQVHVR